MYLSQLKKIAITNINKNHARLSLDDKIGIATKLMEIQSSTGAKYTEEEESYFKLVREELFGFDPMVYFRHGFNELFVSLSWKLT